ncbi:fibrobacter succinogenes major paralogous domain-containing protein [Hallerella succinigenes]|uniref:Uncharacterized protein (TIGR02145 family) n=1 Tax=Hallerella succinigenes TaxID=1896222 RepID=A0A2M9A3W0_9BACT|nr:fibrobacter succinogenes major paralogous domain-containing protein [Hallerella succinigenes]PJJ40406.1 uncharacterized protein (TIGR02145 family) [Hallerella succinigenes]
MNFAKFSLGAFALTAMLVACDSDSASAKDTEIEELSSSSAVEIASSSSTIRNDSLSSSAIESSSSSVMESSSSSETTQSSSSSENISAGSVYDATAKTLKDLRDGQTYKTVVIGEQTWMAENLNYETENSYCYDDDPSNCSKYGRLYTWAAAMDSVKLATDADNPLDCGYGKICGLSGKVQGVCPEGWHLPSYDEWNTLFTAVGGKSTAGAKLKSQTGWAAYGGITNEDSFGFSALPAGYRYYSGDYSLEGYNALFWSSTEGSSSGAYYMTLYYDYHDAPLDYYSKNYGHSVRCVKD